MRLSEAEPLYLAMDSNLHLKSRESRLDGDVLCYVVPRLPDCLPLVREVLLLPCADEHVLEDVRPGALAAGQRPVPGGETPFMTESPVLP